MKMVLLYVIGGGMTSSTPASPPYKAQMTIIAMNRGALNISGDEALTKRLVEDRHRRVMLILHTDKSADERCDRALHWAAFGRPMVRLLRWPWYRELHGSTRHTACKTTLYIPTPASTATKRTKI